MPIYNNICKVCGKDIKSSMSNKKVCSPICRKIANRTYAKDFMRQKRKGIKVVCMRCKDEFITEYSQQNVCIVCQAKY